MLSVFPATSQAEPYLAVREGLSCGGCHVNFTGSGQRNRTGNDYGLETLSATTDGSERLQQFLAFVPVIDVGLDARAGFIAQDIEDEDNRSEFDVEEAVAYLSAPLIEDRITAYIDYRIGPDDSQTRELFVLLQTEDQPFYLKGGRFFIPYGLRLADQQSFSRNVTGILHDAPDEGAELGYLSERWQAQAALSNGGVNGSERDNGKRVSLTGTFIQPRWQLGASLNWNDQDDLRRSMAGLHAGWHTGSWVWLAEVNRIEDRLDDSLPREERDHTLLHLETNIPLAPAQNLRVSAEQWREQSSLDQGGREDSRQRRYSVVWEWFPFAFNQVRIGAHIQTSDQDNQIVIDDLDTDTFADFIEERANLSRQESNTLFLDWHVYF